MTRGAFPLQGEDVVCLASIDWSFNWQGHQEVMAAFAAHGNRVLFVENTGIRAARLRDLPRLKQRFLSWWRSTRGFREERRNLFVYSPVVLPFPHSAAARWINRRLLVRAIERWMRATGFTKPIIWTFLPTPLVVDLIDRIDHRLVVYYCIADFGQLSPRGRQIARSERALLKRADVVFVQGEELQARCAPHANIHIFPFGVNVETFNERVEPALELAGLKRPVIGYVGGLHRHLDIGLVDRVAREVDGTLVLVGPAQMDVGRLRGRSNILLAGPQPHGRVPQFVKGFDVGIIPYVRSTYTRTVYPTKLNEYLAMGIPVVATDLPEIDRFNRDFGHVVSIGRTTDEFVEAVRDATRNAPTPAEAQQRVRVAGQNSWATRIGQMATILRAALAKRRDAAERWEDTLRRLYRTARRRTTAVLATAGLLYIVLFHTPALWLVAEPLRVEDAPQPADAIVVFAGGVGESGKAGGGYQERVKQGVDLYRAGAAPRMILSSGFGYTFRETEVMQELAMHLGVPAEAIILEESAGNTFENVKFVHQILQPRGWRRILLVSSPYHMRRATLTWRKAAPDVTVIASPAPHSQFYAHGSGATFEQLRGIAHEYAAMALYWWKGWL